jgi:hypothetical protein
MIVEPGSRLVRFAPQSGHRDLVLRSVDQEAQLDAPVFGLAGVPGLRLLIL